MPKFSQLKQAQAQEAKNKFILEKVQRCNQEINAILRKYKCRLEFIPQIQVLPSKELLEEAERQSAK